MSRGDLTLMAVLLIATLAVGCASPSQPTAGVTPAATTVAPTIAAQPAAAQPAPAEEGDVALKISGKVDRELAWTEEQVRAMPVIQIKGTNSQGASEDYTGVSLNDLLKQAGIQSGATTLVFTADGEQTSEAALSAVQACAECMPSFPAAVQLKGVTAITVK
jgi:DMSO/TMAO reductase YedYZ molybdopterin-dependent catalytic subunit